MPIWTDGDLLTPNNMNTRSITKLTVTGGGPHVIAGDTSMDTLSVDNLSINTIQSSTNTLFIQPEGSSTTVARFDSDVYMIGDETRRLRMRSFGAARVPVVELARAEGTEAAPTGISGDGTQLGIFQALGHDGTTFLTGGGRIEFESTESWIAATATGTRMNVRVTATGGTSSADVVRVEGAGMNIATAGAVVPTEELHLSGATLRVATNAGSAIAGTDAGNTGDIMWGMASGTTFLYVCVSSNSWMRAALNPF